MIVAKYAMAAGAVILGLAVCGKAVAQPAHYEGDAYAVGAASGAIAKNPYGLCWRTSAWTQAKAIAECDPSLVAQPSPKPAPAVVAAPLVPVVLAPAPAPAPVVVARVIDTDGDGVPDDRDRCPGTAPGRKVDAAGCEIEEVIILKGVTFATNSARLTADSAKTLDAAAETLVKRGNVKTEIGGHTDARGSATHNRALSQQRADAVMKYLVSKGVAPASLSARGYGEDVPIASNASESGRAQNRRVELRAQ